MQIGNLGLKGWALALAVMASVAPARAQEEPIKIGLILSVSGAAAPYGIAERGVAEAMIKKLNDEGGVNGHQIEVHFYDDKSDPTEAVRATTAATRQDGVVAILGAAFGSATLALAPLAERAEVPILTPVATVSALSKENSFFPWIFRSGPSSKTSVEALVEQVVGKAGRKRVGLFYQEDAYGKEEFEYISQLIKNYPGVEVVDSASSAINALDLAPAATRLRNANPDVVIMSTSAVALSSNFVRAAKQVGLNAPLTGTLGLSQKPFTEAAGEAAVGMFATTLVNWDEPTEKQLPLLKLMEEANLQRTGWPDAYLANAVTTLAEAIRRIDGPITGPALRDSIESICDFDGVYTTGKLCYSADNHEGYGPEALAVVELLEGGKQRTVK